MQVNFKAQESTQRDIGMKEEIQKLARRLSSGLKNNCSGIECSPCSLIHSLFQNLIQTQNQQTKQLFQEKIKNDFCLDKEDRSFSKPLNPFSCNLDQLQWKNNQKPTALTDLENNLIMMIKSLCKSSNELEQNSILSDVQKEINCFCNKCLIVRAAKSDKLLNRPDNIKEQKISNSVKEIQQCLASKRTAKQEQQNNKIELILDLIRLERKQLLKAKELKKERNEFIFSLFGDMLVLDKEKYMEDCQVDEAEKKKEKLYQQLFKKNLFNSKQISRFNRRVFLKKSQDKIMKRSSFQSSSTMKIDKQTSPFKDKTKLSQHKIVSITTPQTSRLMNRNLKMTKKDPILQQIPRIRQNLQKYSLMKAKVEKSLEKVQLREDKRSSILKNIVFNAGDLFLVDKRSIIRRVEKPYFSRFDRMMKSSRQMIKMGGVRRSLDQLVSTAAFA